ncbi:MAG TPA: HD-GYP domain-containing protein [Sulfuricella sp.]|nr:HD-GYP domain-containing protein [Sulfuricella sp.]
MIKRIPLSQLKTGMFIHDLNCSWVVHPLFLTRFKVESDAEIEKIAELGVREVYIDPARGIDLPGAETADEARFAVECELLRMGEETGGVSGGLVSVCEERDAAIEIQSHAHQAIRDMMRDIRMGRQLEMERVDQAIGGITDSILRNSTALIQMSRVKTKDNYTYMHSVGVCTLMTAFCNTLELGRDITRQISTGAILHDIGKMKVPDEILTKPGRLTDPEFEEMKRHVSYGCEIVRQLAPISPISFSVLSQHHERYDGSGYPARLKGEEISQFGQMAAIVDVYDAITSDRVYHKAMAPVEAVRKIQEWGEFHFNRELVRHFIHCVGIYPPGTFVRLESGLIGAVVEQNAASLLRPTVRMVYDTRKNWGVTPYELDLSGPSGDADRIVSYEPPEKWGLQPAMG